MNLANGIKASWAFVSSVTLATDVAEEVAELYRQLPDGVMARCYIPNFTIRFYKNDEAFLEGAFCWRCNNFTGNQKGEAVSFAFDPMSSIAQRLRQCCIEITSHNPD